MTNNRLNIPAAALGTWAWGDHGDAGAGYYGSDLTQIGLEQIADRAHEAALTLWDTAVVYGMGRSETLLGRVLKRYPRGDYQLATKFTPQASGDSDDPMGDMLEQSLARLGTDYIDIYWIHNPADVERWTPLLIPLLESGRVKHVGVSNHNMSQITRADEILTQAGHRIEAVQNHYSLLHRSSEHAGILDFCQQQDIPFFAYMVLEQGALTGTYGPDNPLPEGSERAKIYNPILPRLETLTEKLAEVGHENGVTAADIATAWAINKGTTPILGVTKPNYIDALARASTIKLSEEDIIQLEVLADTAGANTRGWWEQEMTSQKR